MQQTLEEATQSFHSLLTHDFNVDGISEIMASRLGKSGTESTIIHPKHMTNYAVKINEKINVMCIARTSLDRGFELVTGDIKGVVRVNSRNGKPFFSKDIKDGIRLPSAVLAAAPGDLNGNKLSEIVVGCGSGEVVMIERIPGRKHRWDKIRGFSLGKIFQHPVSQITTGDFNGNGQMGFIAGSKGGMFKEIEFRPQLQKFDLIGEFKVETEPSFCFSGDIDRDGISEVMVGEYSGRLSIFKRNRLMSTHNLEGAITCGTVGDIDNDRQLEVVVGTANGTINILRQNTIETCEGYSAINDLRIGDLTGNRS
ncbi:VCBS repeat-containing protein, partial [bacterium]|nr:VCBS repeat-containing protein [bacterium]